MAFFFRLLLFFPLFAFSQSDFSNAEKLYLQGNYPQSQILFEKLLRENPNHLKSIEYLGDIRGHAKDWKTALIYYGKLKKLHPSEANYHYKYGGVLGMLAKESNKFKALSMIGEVRESFEKAIELNPKHIDARWALIELYLQLPGIIGGSESKADRYANELLKISPVDGYLAKGRIAEYFNRFSTAEKYYKQAIVTGGSKTTYQKLADLYKNKMNQPEKAKAAWVEFNNKNKS
jgi:tetratricopeptide (TPR) repeat protein